MSGPLPHLYAERLDKALQRALAFNEAKSHELTRQALETAKEWLDKLREAMP